jgi:nitrogen regulatory protein PII
MKEIKAIIQPYMLQYVCDALETIEQLPGITISSVAGFGKTRGLDAAEALLEGGRSFAKKTRIDIVVPDALVERVVEAIVGAAHTGKPGDGKVFVTETLEAVKIRTGERGESAL